VSSDEFIGMNAIALILVACLPHVGQCKSIVQHPAPTSDRECTERAEKLQQAVAGTIDDAGYRPIQVTCLYAYPDRDGE
jgi:O-acetylhomoserine/O-acetylserine sulfhydrylase-like pyridoxal-dependent enzyme